MQMSDYEANAIASAVLDYLASQTYNSEPVLHAIICCDFASYARMTRALAKVILEVKP